MPHVTGQVRFSDIGAVVFDAYGTLIDISEITNQCRDALGDKAEALSRLWREKQLQYTWLRSLMGAYVDFWHVTSEALEYAMAALGIANPPLRALLMQLYLSPKIYADVLPTLQQLRAKGLRTAILSNGSPTMLAAAVNSNVLRPSLDAVLSVDAVKTYKPHPSVYQLAVDRMAVPATRILFVSANGWDAVGAGHFGFHVAWINRSGLPQEALPHRSEAEIKSLAELPALLGL
ncbi:MAG: haloacid dehalogenase type II [Proteobacteria bacterium]|nr:haloacid dehalogenase type II [Pseudomonadota bacterium]MBI3497479.1 haloacid dehalogenase type II [Pseudomonadota bacterium]